MNKTARASLRECHDPEYEAKAEDMVKLCKCGTLMVDMEATRELIDKLSDE